MSYTLHKTPILWGLWESHGRQPYPQHFFGEANSWTQTCDLSLFMEGTCHTNNKVN